MINIKNLSFQYGEEEPTRKAESGLSRINLHIHPGECVLLCGESGCGKTTLTKAVNGLIPYFEEGRLNGSVSVDAHEVQDTPMYELAKSVSSVFQNPRSQFFNTDAESEITFALENQGVLAAEIDKRFALAVSSLGIEPLLGKSLFAMSGGEKQIIAFAGAYISGTRIVVLDEPSSNLDADAIHKIQEIIEKMKADGKTILIAEHRVSYLRNLVDNVYYIRDGKVDQHFSAVKFYEMSNHMRTMLGLRQLAEPAVTSIIRVKNSRTAEENILEIKNLMLTYGKNVVAQNINLSLQSGDIVGIVGKNGVGKSTFSRVLCGLHEQKQGEVRFNGKVMKKKDLRRCCGIVMQDVNYQLFSDSVYGECLLGNGKVSESRVNETLEELGLTKLRNVHPQSLSGGQKQRLAIAAALVSDKKVLILDEPTSGLDYKNMMAVSGLLHKLAEKGILCIVVTHDTEFLSAACNRCFRLEKTGAYETENIRGMNCRCSPNSGPKYI